VAKAPRRAVSPEKKDDERPLGERLRESARYTVRTARLVFRSAPRLASAFVALTLAASALPLAVAFIGKRLVDAVVAKHEREALAWVAAELAVVVTLALVSRGAQLARLVLGSRLGVDVNTAILAKATTLSLPDFEDSELYDRMTRARREASSRPVALVSDAFSFVQNTLTLLGYLALLVGFGGWVAALLLLSTVPATIAEVRFGKKQFKLRNWRSPESRKLLYLEQALASDEHAKEIRLFDLGALFLGRYVETAEAFYQEDTRLAVKKSATTTGLSLIATLALYATYASVALLAARGALSLGTMTMYVLAFRQGQSAFQSALSSVGSIYEHNLYMSNLFGFLGDDEASFGALPAISGDGATSGAKPDALPSAPRSGGAEIRFEGVGFRYPGKEAYALRGIDLVLRPGEKVALVGHNGAGKTTFVKLMTASTRRPRGASSSTAGTSPSGTGAPSSEGSAWSSRTSTSTSSRSARTSGSVRSHACKTTTRSSAPSRGAERPRSSSRSPRRAASTPRSAVVPRRCGALRRTVAEDRASPEGSCARTPTCSCSTSPRPRSTPRASTWCSTGSRPWPRAHDPRDFPSISDGSHGRPHRRAGRRRGVRGRHTRRVGRP
jgi:ABC-type siderophore export system fused ATPase/permease subunit